MRRPLHFLMAASLVVTSSAAAAAAAAPPVRSALSRAAAIARAAGLSGEIMIMDVSGRSKGAAMGLADRRRGTRHRVGERWLWASVTKQVTAVLVLQEAERGTLELDAPVGRYLPVYAKREITLRQLLQHQSGLPNPIDTPADASDVQSFFRETGTAIGDGARAKGFCAGAAKRAPGGDFEYNNCDYLVLGAVLEAVTGERYSRLVERRIALPLGLKSCELPRMARSVAVRMSRATPLASLTQRSTSRLREQLALWLGALVIWQHSTAR